MSVKPGPAPSAPSAPPPYADATQAVEDEETRIRRIYMADTPWWNLKKTKKNVEKAGFTWEWIDRSRNSFMVSREDTRMRFQVKKADLGWKIEGGYCHPLTHWRKGELRLNGSITTARSGEMVNGDTDAIYLSRVSGGRTYSKTVCISREICSIVRNRSSRTA